ncbi:hypothetical protein SKA34_16915 [Photobacterium sp. SKA34]|uniref:hypothetical protein n=1 Tax=Photobacterium sp. SKA34 TaxID=121723 RepID=UPI00006BEB1B|nr:hypothetical protein [Photobacterium sp. SKA34]EAR55870.1 hypothetical protein SKA34_16915 [Photobacterium sp. SKA34]
MSQDVIGFVEYFATGEGLTHILVSGTEEQIKEFLGPYFSLGVEFFSFDEMKKNLLLCEKRDIENCTDDDAVRAACILHEHLPHVATLIKKYGYCSFSYKSYFNLG